MIYNLSNRIHQEQAKTKLEYFISKEKTITLTEKRKTRSVSQNAYLHLILSAFGLEFGYTLDEVKQYIFKEHINSDIFYDGDKHGLLVIKSWRSTADLDTKEMTTAIDRLLDYSAKNGFRLPEPSDLAWINEIKNNIESNKQYL